MAFTKAIFKKCFNSLYECRLVQHSFFSQRLTSKIHKINNIRGIKQNINLGNKCPNLSYILNIGPLTLYLVIIYIETLLTSAATGSSVVGNKAFFATGGGISCYCRQQLLLCFDCLDNEQ